MGGWTHHWKTRQNNAVRRDEKKLVLKLTFDLSQYKA